MLTTFLLFSITITSTSKTKPMKIHFIIAIGLIAINTLLSCGNEGAAELNATEHEAEHEAEHEEGHEEGHENPNTATLTEAQMESIGIELGVIEDKQLTASLKTNGVLKVPNQNKASVNSMYSGVIDLFTLFAVQISGRFIGEDEAWF